MDNPSPEPCSLVVTEGLKEVGLDFGWHAVAGVADLDAHRRLRLLATAYSDQVQAGADAEQSPAGMASIALSIRFRKTCLRWSGLAWIRAAHSANRSTRMWWCCSSLSLRSSTLSSTAPGRSVAVSRGPAGSSRACGARWPRCVHFSPGDLQVAIHLVAALVAIHLLLDEGQTVLDGLEWVADLVRNRGAKPAQGAIFSPGSTAPGSAPVPAAAAGPHRRAAHSAWPDRRGRPPPGPAPIFIGKGVTRRPPSQHKHGQQVALPPNGDSRPSASPSWAGSRSGPAPRSPRRRSGHRLSLVPHPIQEACQSLVDPWSAAVISCPTLGLGEDLHQAGPVPEEAAADNGGYGRIEVSRHAVAGSPLPAPSAPGWQPAPGPARIGCAAGSPAAPPGKAGRCAALRPPAGRWTVAGRGFAPDPRRGPPADLEDTQHASGPHRAARKSGWCSPLPLTHLERARGSPRPGRARPERCAGERVW
jgi:hypothetical protein